jgi:hypothetical protein
MGISAHVILWACELPKGDGEAVVVSALLLCCISHGKDAPSTCYVMN